MRKRVIWITGAAGFSGRHLVRALRSVDDSAQLVGLGRIPATVEGLDVFHPANLMEDAGLRQLAESHPPHLVFHLAGAVPPAPEPVLWGTNVGGTHQLIQSLPARSPLRVVVISSAAVYHTSRRNLRETDPAGGGTPYGRSKWCQETVALAAARERGLAVLIARPFNLIGPGLPESLVAGSLCSQFRRRGESPVQVGSLSPVRDFVDVRDAVNAYWCIAQKGRPGAIYNVCTGRATRIASLLRLFQEETSSSPRPVASRDLPHPGGGANRAVGNPEKLIALGWKPSISLRRSVSDMLHD